MTRPDQAACPLLHVPDVSEVRTVTPPTEDAGTQYPTSQVELPAAPPTADNGGPAAPLTTDAATQSAKSLGELPAWLSALNIPAGMSFSASANFIFPAVLPTDAVKQLDTLDGIAGMIAACRACALGYTALNPVPGEGNPNADVVCVGEAPGQTEDETGRPFVGASGQLLTKILGAIQLQREDVFICNVVKHRPPGNRNPLPDEVRACAPYLRRQLELVKPKVIIALGTSAAQALLNTSIPMGKLRGQLHRYEGIPVIVTYHPSALLRNENWKRPAWDDVRLARRILDAARAALPPTH